MGQIPAVAAPDEVLVADADAGCGGAVDQYPVSLTQPNPPASIGNFVGIMPTHPTSGQQYNWLNNTTTTFCISGALPSDITGTFIVANETSLGARATACF